MTQTTMTQRQSFDQVVNLILGWFKPIIKTKKYLRKLNIRRLDWKKTLIRNVIERKTRIERRKAG
jgi:hypothetical protein